MGLVGRWIDKRVEQEPDVMRTVLELPFGNLEVWISSDGGCGCLIGTYMLVQGVEPVVAYLGPDTETEHAVGIAVANIKIRFMRGRSRHLGLYLPDINASKEDRATANRIAERLIKSRIRRRLAERDMRLDRELYEAEVSVLSAGYTISED